MTQSEEQFMAFEPTKAGLQDVVVAVSETNEKKTQKVTAANPYSRLSNAGRAERLFSQAESEERLDNDELNNLLYNLVDALLMEGKTISGDADDFHNLSVTLLRRADDYETAMEIVSLGLRIHPADADLLADGIRYGTNCGQADKSNELFRQLRQIDYSLWTWRAFSFSIDYMLDKYVSHEDDIKLESIFELVHLYQKYYPSKEDSRFIEYQVCEKINQIDKGLAVLQKAINELSYCPKCWLRYADIMIEQGRNSEAETCIKKLRSRPQSAEAVNASYVYYLDGLCRINAILDSASINEDEVIQAFKVLRIAKKHSSLRKGTERKINDLIAILENETEIPFSD